MNLYIKNLDENTDEGSLKARPGLVPSVLSYLLLVRFRNCSNSSARSLQSLP